MYYKDLNDSDKITKIKKKNMTKNKSLKKIKNNLNANSEHQTMFKINYNTKQLQEINLS